MKLITTTEFIGRYEKDEVKGIKTAIKLIKDAGFDGFDITLDSMTKNENSVFMSENWREAVVEIKNYADELGIPCLQAHAPFWHVRQREDGERLYPYYVRTLEICSILKCPIVVIHPCNDLSDEETHEIYYSTLVPLAEKLGVRIATENMWNWNKEQNCSVAVACGTVERFNHQIDLANSHYLTGCVDIGHAEMQGIGNPTAYGLITGMGKDRVGCLHVHDNDCLHDDHTAPYSGKIDWESVIKALREINYCGNFTFEADNFFKRYPFELVPSGLAHLHDIGRYFIRRITE